MLKGLTCCNGISHAIRANSGEAIRVDIGSIDPALHRLERQRWIASEWKVLKTSSVSPSREH